MSDLKPCMHPIIKEKGGKMKRGILVILILGLVAVFSSAAMAAEFPKKKAD